MTSESSARSGSADDDEGLTYATLGRRPLLTEADAEFIQKKVNLPLREGVDLEKLLFVLNFCVQLANYAAFEEDPATRRKDLLRLKAYFEGYVVLSSELAHLVPSPPAPPKDWVNAVEAYLLRLDGWISGPTRIGRPIDPKGPKTLLPHLLAVFSIWFGRMPVSTTGRDGAGEDGSTARFLSAVFECVNTRLLEAGLSKKLGNTARRRSLQWDQKSPEAQQKAIARALKILPPTDGERDEPQAHISPNPDGETYWEALVKFYKEIGGIAV